jgi:hypothetical protein
MATTSQSGTKPGCTPVARTSPSQHTLLRPGPLASRNRDRTGHAVAMIGRDVAALQSEQFSYSCRASFGTGLVDPRSSTSVSRRSWRPEAGTRWVREHSF